MDNSNYGFMVLEGDTKSPSYIAWSFGMSENEAVELMKQKMKNDKSQYMVVEVKHISDEYNLNLQEEFDREIHLMEKKMESLQRQIDELKNRKERVKSNE